MLRKLKLMYYTYKLETAFDEFMDFTSTHRYDEIAERLSDKMLERCIAKVNYENAHCK